MPNDPNKRSMNAVRLWNNNFTQIRSTEPFEYVIRNSHRNEYEFLILMLNQTFFIPNTRLEDLYRILFCVFFIMPLKHKMQPKLQHKQMQKERVQNENITT